MNWTSALGEPLLGWQLAARHLPARRALQLALLFLTLAALGGLVEGQAASTHAVYRGLSGVAFGLCLPLFVYFVVDRSLAGGNVLSALNELARQGAHRRRVARGVIARALVVTLPFGVLVGTVLVWLVRARSSVAEPLSLGADLLIAAWLGALGGLAYVAFSFLLSTLGGGRGARLIGLGADWLLGTSTGAVSMPWPRAHLDHLLGGAAAFSVPQPTTALVLAFGSVAALALTLWRTPP